MLPAPPIDDFLRLACLTYGHDDHPSRRDRARALLETSPDLPRLSLPVAAAIGDVAAVHAMLEAAPHLASAPDGPFGWEPLLYLVYSRVQGESHRYSAPEVARLLLEYGADPNAGFLWEQQWPPFTALTGCFGEGENGPVNCPPHPDCQALARLLLGAGADPNDGQTLYNRQFTSGRDHLELLLEHGLGKPRGGPWYERGGHRLTSPDGLLHEQLCWAAAHNHPDRVSLLLEHGADAARLDRQGSSPWQLAILGGNLPIAAYLEHHGAPTVPLDSIDTFVAACMGADRAAAAALLAETPALLVLAFERYPSLLHHAVENRHPEAVRLLIHLGADVNTLARNTPLHQAAWQGDLDMARLLIDLGADPAIRDHAFHATPRQWADHNHQRAMASFLAGREAEG